MNVVIIHFSLNFMGGAEKLCLSTVQALKHAGHTVTLATIEKTDWKAVQRNLGTVTLPNREIYFTSAKLSKRLSNLGISATLLVLYLFEHFFLRWSRKYDIIVSTFGDLFDLIADVTYVHFPIKASQEYSQILPISNERKWRFQSRLYNLVISTFSKLRSRLILVNSSIISEIVQSYFQVGSKVLSPPVDVYYFMRLAENQQREDTIVTVSGYSSKKHLEQIPIIASHIKSGRFLVVGKTDEYSSITIEKLETLTRELNVEDRVGLLRNVPRSELRKILSQAKIYLHTMINEHFGTTIVQAMASGCVPIVHKSGGPWLDILQQRQGRYGYAYDTSKEASKYVELLLQNENLRRKIASAAMKRSREYDQSVFAEKIVAIVENVYSSKHKEKQKR